MSTALTAWPHERHTHGAPHGAVRAAQSPLSTHVCHFWTWTREEDLLATRSFSEPRLKNPQSLPRKPWPFHPES